MITSTSSNQVKNVIQLQKKAKVRKEQKQFIVEGAKMVVEAPAEQVVKVYASETFSKINASIIEELQTKLVDVELTSDQVFDRMADTQTPQGILAIMKMQEHTLEELCSTDKIPLLIGVENLQDPGNLGTILRMGEGAGVTGVVISANSVDIYNPKTIRSTMGSLYRMPFVSVQDFPEAIKTMQQHGVAVYAAHLDGTMEYTEPDYQKPTAFLIGNEGNGLTSESAMAADMLVRIPMEGRVESLNAAIACTVLTYEAMRQRRSK